ncbi:MAG: hypothetical protein AAGA15_15135 [Pseudomonadota bacterium]
MAADARNGAHKADGVLGGGDDRKLGAHVFLAPRAKKAEALLTIPFSSFRRLFS